MNDSAFIIFILIGTIWVLMATAGVIAILRMDGQEIKFGKTGFIIIVSIIVPIIITLTYAALHRHVLNKMRSAMAAGTPYRSIALLTANP